MGNIKLRKWDAVEYLKTEQDMVMYLNACLDENDPSLLVAALGDIARARGMAPLGDETLKSNPSFSSILKVMHALGFKLVAQPIQAQEAAHS